MKDVLDEEVRIQISRLPREPGVYLFKDSKGQILYVGKAKDLRNRVSSYLRDGADGRHHIQYLVGRVKRVDFIVTGTEQEALILENNLIKRHRPRYNIFFKDDKTYVNVRLNVDHAFPRLTVVRNPRKDKALYFGPYASAGSVRATIRTLGRIFPMRTCTDADFAGRTRPCLYYYIHRCPAPCVGYIDEKTYRDTVGKVIMLLKGRGEELLKSLKSRMDLQAAERKYEDAARTRDQIYAVQRTLERQRITSTGEANRDVFGHFREHEKLAIQVLHIQDGKLSGGNSYYFDNANLPDDEHLSSFLSQFYQSGAAVPEEVLVPIDIPDRNVLEAYLRGRRDATVNFRVPRKGEGRRLVELAVRNARAALNERGLANRHRDVLEELRDLLELKNFPRRIECFDISNLQGAHAVASGVTFIEGEASKTLYRHYRVRTVKGSNDVRMMEEILERRVARGIKEGDLPDLLIVDGGRGQLNAALAVVERLGVDHIDVLGIAKVRDEGGMRKVRGKERIYAAHLPEPLLLEGRSEALHLLERIRDEAHRFAITHHKRVRNRGLTESALDAIPGLGPVLKKRLLIEFGSIEGLRKARTADVASVRGISVRLAAQIKEFLAQDA